jgi:peptide/nickel transport system substrate-binding protein
MVTITLLALAAACGGEPREEGVIAEGGEPESGGTAVISEAADMSQPFALLSRQGLEGTLQDVLYMTLLRGEWSDGRLVLRTADENPMALARSYEYYGPDSASIRYRLRSDARWSDGEAITADDVSFTYQLLRSPELASPRQDYTEKIDSVVAENDSTVSFHFARRYPEMEFHASHGIVPRHVYETIPPGDLATHPTVRSPEGGQMVVSGAYLIEAWNRGQQVVLGRNPYFEPRGHLDRVIFRIIPDVTTRVVELQTGNIDWMPAVPIDRIAGLRQQATDLRFEREEKRYYDYIAYNPAAHPGFADPEIRRALGLAIDVPRIIAALQLEEYAVPAAGPYPPIFAELYDSESMSPLRHDADEARRILAARGWADANGDGILEKEGRPFSFTLTTNTGNQRRADVSQIVQQQWRAIGVEAELRTLEYATMMDEFVNETYEAGLGGWGVALSSDLTGLWGAESQLNIVSYAGEAQPLFQQALDQPTDEAAAPLWKQGVVELIEDQPYTWLYYLDQVNALSSRLRGVDIDTYGPYQNIWEWWIPQRLQGRGAAAAPPDTAN